MPETIREFFYASAKKNAEKTLFMEKKDGEYKNFSYRRYRSDVEALGTELVGRGFKDKPIILMGENGYSWVLTYMAVVCGVGIIIPTDKELSAEELQNIAKISGAKGIFFSESCRVKAETLEGVEKFAFSDIDALLEAGRERLNSGDKTYLTAEINPDKMAVLLFTSGTTGVSKGVMLSNRNICAALYRATPLIDMNENDTLLSVLPLHHTYECSCGFLSPVYVGATVAFCEGLKYILKNLKEVRPTLLICVPLLAETMYKKIKANIAKKGLEKKVDAVIKATNVLGKNNKLAVAAKKKLFAEIHDVFGGRLRLIVSGGASIDPAIMGGLRDFGINAIQGYGLTECAPLVAINPTPRPKDASAGMGLIGANVDIYNVEEDGTGEIRYKGENVMLGYFGDPELTAETIRDGWFYTGDLGYIDSEGYIFITGRKKNVIVNAGGKNIFPEELEVYLGRCPFIKESVVVGIENESHRDYDIVAVIHPDYDKFAEAYGKSYSITDIERELEAAVESTNASVQSYKHINMFIIRKEEFEKNSSRKIKRANVLPSVIDEYKEKTSN